MIDMNVLKYQAWNKHLKKMQQVLEIILAPDTGGVIVSGDQEADQEFWPWSDISLRVCIPYRDKDGNDIYTGDIVATGRSAEHARSVVRIGEARTPGSDCCYAEDYYGIYLERTLDLEDSLRRGNMYVIGNIYEHSNL